MLNIEHRRETEMRLINVPAVSWISAGPSLPKLAENPSLVQAGVFACPR